MAARSSLVRGIRDWVTRTGEERSGANEQSQANDSEVGELARKLRRGSALIAVLLAFAGVSAGTAAAAHALGGAGGVGIIDASWGEE